jgi:hypothetical protein
MQPLREVGKQLTMKKHVILVLGMHRSGTSALTNALTTMGVNLGENLMPPHAGVNDKGFFEDVEFFALNVKILSFLESDWHHLSPPQENYITKLESAGLFTAACELVHRKFETTHLFGLKDPRIPKLLEFWKFVFDKCDVSISYLICVRSPLAVADSLYYRDGFPEEKSLHLWLTHTLNSLFHTHSHRRVVVHYDRLLTAPRFELDRISKHLGLEIRENLANEYISGFLDGSLRHSRRALGEDKDCRDFSSLVRRTYSLVLSAASDEVDINDESFAAAANALHSELGCHDFFTRLIDDQTVAISERDARINGLHIEATGLQVRLRELAQEASEVHSLLAQQASEIDRCHSELLNIKTSNSWKITRPMRVSARLLRGEVTSFVDGLRRAIKGDEG